jgi:cytochrome c553
MNGSVMPNNATQSPIYESYTMLHPDGTFMCHCNKKRANWYISRDLAEWIDNTQFKLKFEPQGYGKANNPYYQQTLQNRCVVCGELAGLNKHHVFPYVFRSRAPIQYKESNHHDIVPICIECHEDYEAHANKYKEMLANQYDLAMNGAMTEAQRKNRKIISARKILQRLEEGDFLKIPQERLDLLKVQANQELSEEFSSEGAIWADKIMENVMKDQKLQEFICSWRQHFIDFAKPQYLPPLWSVHHPLEVIGRYLEPTK